MRVHPLLALATLAILLFPSLASGATDAKTAEHEERDAPLEPSALASPEPPHATDTVVSGRWTPEEGGESVLSEMPAATVPAAYALALDQATPLFEMPAIVVPPMSAAPPDVEFVPWVPPAFPSPQTVEPDLVLSWPGVASAPHELLVPAPPAAEPPEVVPLTTTAIVPVPVPSVVPPTHYVVETVAGSTRKLTVVAMGSEGLIDADDSPTTGLAGIDLGVRVAPLLPGIDLAFEGATVRIDGLGTTRLTSLLVKVHVPLSGASAADPAGAASVGDGSVVFVGYDVISGMIPSVFSVRAAVDSATTLQADTNSLIVNVTTGAAPAGLVLRGGTYTGTPASAVVGGGVGPLAIPVLLPAATDMLEVGARLDPVPASFGARLDLTDADTYAEFKVTWEADATTRLDLTLSDYQSSGARGNSTSLTVGAMPTRLSETFRTYPATSRLEVAHRASAKIDSLVLNRYAWGPGGSPTTSAIVSSLPREVDVALEGSSAFDLVASDAIGFVDFSHGNVGLSISGEGLSIYSVGTSNAVRARLGGLREAHYAFLAPKHSISAVLVGGQAFRFTATTAGASVVATISNLPPAFTLLSDFRYEMDYAATASIRTLTASVTAGANTLSLTVRDIPTRLRYRTDLVGYVDYEADAALTLLDIVTAAPGTSLRLTAEGLPTDLDLTMRLPSSLRYLANDRLGRLLVSYSGGTPLTSFTADVFGLPPSVDLRVTDTGVELDADGHIGSLAASIRIGTSPPSYAPAGDYAVYAIGAGGTQIAARLTNLRSFRYLGAGEELEADLVTGGGLPLNFVYAPPGGLVSGTITNLPAEISLLADFRRHISYHASASIDSIVAQGSIGTRTFRTEVSALPADVELWLSLTRGNVRLATGDPIGRLLFETNDPTGVSPPYKLARIEVLELASFDLLFTSDGLLDFRTSDPLRSVASIDARLAATAYRVLPGSHALQWDAPGDEALSLRVLGLSVASVDARGGALRAETATTAQRFDVQLRDRVGNLTSLVVADVPPRVLVASDLQTRYDYLASAPVSRIWLNRTEAAGPTLTVAIRDLPSRLDLVVDRARGDFTFDVAQPVGRLDVALAGPGAIGASPYDRAALTIMGLPSMTAHVRDNYVDVRTRDALESVGRITAALGRGSLPAAFTTRSHVLVVDRPTADALRVDIAGFQAVSVDRRTSELVAYLRLATSQDFEVRLENATATSTITVLPLPAEIRLRTDLQRTLLYDASQRIGRLTVTTSQGSDFFLLDATGVPAHIAAGFDLAAGLVEIDLDQPLTSVLVQLRRPGGIGSSAFRNADVTIQGLPSLTLRWNRDFTDVDVRTHDTSEAIGLVDVALSSGAYRRLAGDHAFVWSDAVGSAASLRVHLVRVVTLDMSRGVRGELLRDPYFDLQRLPSAARVGATAPPTFAVRIEDRFEISRLNVTSLPARIAIETDLAENHRYSASGGVFDVLFSSSNRSTGAFRDLRVFGIPDQLTVRVAPAAGRVDFDPSTPIDHAIVSLYEPARLGTSEFRRLRVDAVTIPDLHLRWTSANDLLSFSSAGTVGVVNASLASDTLTYFPRYMGDYVVVQNRTLANGGSAIAARVSGLRGASFDTRGDLMRVGFETAVTHRLDFLVQNPRSDLAGYVRDLPRNLSIVTDAASYATYTASDPIGRLNVTANERTQTGAPSSSFIVDVRGVPTALDARFDSSAKVALFNASSAIQELSFRMWSAAGIGTTGYKSAFVLVKSLPRSLGVAFTDGPTEVILNTGPGQSIGEVNVALTNQPAFRTWPVGNYAFVHDTTSEKSVSVRILGLRHAELTNAGSLIHANLRTGGGPLRTHVETSSLSLFATETALPADFTFDSNLQSFFHVRGQGGALSVAACVKKTPSGGTYGSCSDLSVRVATSSLPRFLNATLAGANIALQTSESLASLSLDLYTPEGITENRFTVISAQLTNTPLGTYVSANDPAHIEVRTEGGPLTARFLMAKTAVQDYAVTNVVHVVTDSGGGLQGILAKVSGLSLAEICTSCAPQRIHFWASGGGLFLKIAGGPKPIQIWMPTVAQLLSITLKTDGVNALDHERYIRYSAWDATTSIQSLLITLDTAGQLVYLSNVPSVPRSFWIDFPSIPATDENGYKGRCGGDGTVNKIIITKNGALSASMFEMRFISSDKLNRVHAENVYDSSTSTATYFAVCIAPNEGLLIPDGFVDVYPGDRVSLKLWFGGEQSDGTFKWTFFAAACNWDGHAAVDLVSLVFSSIDPDIFSAPLTFFLYTSRTRGIYIVWGCPV